MNLPNLCPACLTELPDNYPYDHVETDRALAGEAGLFRSMSRGQQAEVIRTGLARRRSYASMSRLFMRSVGTLTDPTAPYGAPSRHTKAQVAA